MEFNRLVSLVLGFVVLILVFVWISNRFRASTRTADGRTPTITPTYTPTPSKEADSASRWNPFGFLSRNSNESPTPSVIKTSPSPTAIKVKIETTGTIAQATSPTAQPTKKAAQPTKQQTPKQNPTATKVPAPQPQDKTYTNNKTGKTSTIAQIPETGASSALLPMMMVALSGGIYLRRKV